MSIAGLAGFYEVFIRPEQLSQAIERNNLTISLEDIQLRFIVHKILFISLLGCLILVWRSAWGRKHPAIMLVLMPWAIAFIPEMLFSGYFGIPSYPSTIMFMAQAVIVPVYWRLHFLAQIVPIAFYFLVYPPIGLAIFGGQSIYSFSYTVEIILVCVICEFGVYLYEQSKQSELESNRRLQLCLHSITHDLRTPVMGSLMLLRSIQESTPTHQPIQLSETEMKQLIHGGDRLLHLMNRFLDAQTFSQIDLVLHQQPTHLSTIVTTILQDFHSDLIKQNVQVKNQILPDLPLIEVDVQQIERVFSNLIANAISHNPPGITLTLDAVRCSSMLKVIVQDNGVGISPIQQEKIFEPYTRGQQTQYLPGLGLGLY
ncbi:hypothetical protein HC928_25420, partial [bacterium]|nr:hypothetical protein [bacterium]